MLTASEKKIIRKRIEKTLAIYHDKVSALNNEYRSMRKYNKDLEMRMTDTDAELGTILKEVERSYDVFEKRIREI